MQETVVTRKEIIKAFEATNGVANFTSNVTGEKYPTQFKGYAVTKDDVVIAIMENCIFIPMKVIIGEGGFPEVVTNEKTMLTMNTTSGEYFKAVEKYNNYFETAVRFNETHPGFSNRDQNAEACIIFETRIFN